MERKHGKHLDTHVVKKCLQIIEKVKKWAEEIPNLVGIILFGSAVTGEVSRKSDIDLLLVPEEDGRDRT